MNKTILLAEDDNVTAKALSATLEKHGYSCVIAGSGLEAVSIAHTDLNINLVLMDIELGEGIDGAEAARQILAKRLIPIVFLTSHPDKDYFDRVKGITRYGFIIKNSGNFILLSSIEMAYELFAEHENMQQSEEKYRLVFDYSPLGLVHFNEQGIISACNDIFVGIIGSSQKALIGLNMLKLPDLRIREAVEFTLNGGLGHYEGVYKSVTADKSTPVRIVFAPMKSSDGHIIGGVGVVEDITERQRTLDLIKKSNEELEAANSELAATNEEFEAMNEELIASNQDLIYEKQKAEERERNYREIFDSSNDAIFIQDNITGEILDVNNTMLKMYGFNDKEEALKYSIKDLSAPDIIYSVESASELMKDARKYDLGVIEWHARKKNGELFWVDVSLKNSVINGENRIMATVRDITRRKQIEDELRVNELIFSLFMENSPIYIFFKDASIRSLRLSRNFEQLLGKPLNELLGKTMDELFPSDFAKKMIEDDTKILYEGKLVNIEEEFNGRYYETTKYPIFQDGKPSYLAGYTIDITERKLAEEKLASEKERLSVTLRSIGDGVITTDINGNVEILNRVAEELTGWTQDEARGKSVGDVYNIIDELTLKPHVSPVLKALETGRFEESTNDTILISKDGTERLVLESGSPIKDRNSSTIGVVIVFRDITEKRKFEETVQKAQKLESLGVLAGGIAHDFNNLLGGIFGSIDLAKLKNKDNNLAGYFNGALSAIERARGLTQQLLTFSRGGTPVMKPGRLLPFIQDSVQFALSGSNVSCRFDLPENLPGCYFDKNQIGQVIDNLIINAQQAMPMGGILDVSARSLSFNENEHAILRPGNYVRISIRDRGIGIPKEIIPFIFDPFFSTKAKGHGLGLATCYSIISRHGGAIDVESTPGEGSTFSIFLSVSAESADADAKAQEIRHKGRGRIIVMDDEEIILNILEEMLAEFGYSVVTMKDGKDAVKYFIEETGLNNDFAAMIFDLTVPGGTGGIEAVEEIRKINTIIPVFVSSGYSEDPVMANPQDFGFTASIRKPFQISELSEMLEKHIINK
jgi:PAS domain S-box-containing protein